MASTETSGPSPLSSTPLSSHETATSSSSSPPSSITKQSEFYGVLESPNIRRVCLGKYEFDSWYGNAAYFATDHSTLGFKKVVSTTGTAATHEKHAINSRKSTITVPTAVSPTATSQFWLEKLFVCEYCFKYSDVEQECQSHRAVCPFNRKLPPIGELLYKDDYSPYIITKVRGFENEVFTQNLCLFGKLFLDNKSVYYNTDPFDFYLIYGHDLTDDVRKDQLNFKPMGFFSKEVMSWDGDNNLACICVFPPYQRRGLGSLLIEFSYELAAVTPGQKLSGPEFPLSPFGKMSYYNLWSKRLAIVLYEYVIQEGRSKFNLSEIANLTGYRKEDILITLEYMKVLQSGKVVRKGKNKNKNGVTSTQDDDFVYFSRGNFENWCSEKNIDVRQEKRMLNPDYLVL